MQRKKRNIVEWAMHYRQIVIMITCCLVVLGIIALDSINKNEFPDFTVRQGVVIAAYPGASAIDVEEQVTKPLEDYIFTYKEVKKAKTKSYSRDGLAIVQVELNDDVSENDKDNFWSKFKHGVAAFKAELPSGVMALQVKDDFGDTSALLITMESDDKTYRELDHYMNRLKDRLRQVESVGRMTVAGMQHEQISVYFDSERLAHYAISPQTIALRLAGNGFVTTAGTLRTDGFDSPIQVKRSLNAAADVEQIVVHTTSDGSMVRLKDVATVRREYPTPSSFVTNNGHKCLVLSVEMKKGRNITKMGADIDRAISEFQQELPASVKLFKVTDQPKVVGDSVLNFLGELLIAIAAVVIVVMLLLPIRVALVAASTIPITIFISLGLFHAFGIELNTVTLAALIVTLGMIVDNSIVIIDSYMEKLAEGQSRWHASIESAVHFFRSILTATLAISVTFFPFLFIMTGMFHDFLLSFPWAITIVLLISLAVAELIVPFMQFHFIRKPIESKRDNDGRRKFSFLDLLQRHYDRLIDLCFSHPRVTIGVGVLSVVIGAILVTSLPQRLMPNADRNQFSVEIYLPTGASIEQTAAIADSLESLIARDERVVSIASFKGTSSPRFHTAYAPQFGGANYAQFIVNTTSEKATEEVLALCHEHYDGLFPQAYVRFKQLSFGSEENPVELRLTGDDRPTLARLADSLTMVLRRDGQLALVRNDMREPLAATVVSIDGIKAGRLGVTNAQVESALAMAYNPSGLPLGTVWDGDQAINVCLKSTHADSATIDDVASEPMAVAAGLGSVPLRQMADMSHEWQFGQISHRGGLRTITIMADVVGGNNVMQVTSRLQEQFSDLTLPDGVALTWGGEVAESGERMPDILAGLAMAAIIIFFLLVAHFHRIGTAVLLLCSLAMTLFGTGLGVAISGVDFSMTCFLGIISLMGILVRNAIIMYDYAEELRTNEHLSAREAIYTSAKRRMRPIFLTSAAASMGVIPMILGGSGLWMPMGSVICYGTIVTMLLILTVLPVAYWLTMRGTTEQRIKAEAIEHQ